MEAVLEKLANRAEGSLVVKLPREAGKRESRYQHLLSGAVDVDSIAAAMPVSSTMSHSSENSSSQRIESLEKEVAELKNELAELKALVESVL